MKRTAFAIIAATLLSTPLHAAGISQHYAPTENLERIDVELLGQAKETIDIAAYNLTDWPVIDALHAARSRGVAVRILLDPTQRHNLDRLGDLLDMAKKKRRGPIMHLKSYAIDGRVLRTGSANFSAGGLKQQNNDLIVIDDITAVDRFEDEFERVWETGVPPVNDAGSDTSAAPDP